jgi:hypothetical protein
MLAETFFNNNEAAKIENNNKKFKKIVSLIIIIGVPLEFFAGFLASKKYHTLFLPVTAVGLIILLLVYYFVFLKGLESIKKDISEQIKLVGELQVVSKSEKEKCRIIGLNSPQLESISISKDAFDKIDIGDILFIEISKYTKYIFRLSKDGETIINGV